MTDSVSLETVVLFDLLNKFELLIKNFFDSSQCGWPIRNSILFELETYRRFSTNGWIWLLYRWTCYL